MPTNPTREFIQGDLIEKEKPFLELLMEWADHIDQLNAKVEGWVSVDERLPELGSDEILGVDVVAAYADGSIQAMSAGELLFMFTPEWTWSKPTHWMPLYPRPRLRNLLCGR